MQRGLTYLLTGAAASIAAGMAVWCLRAPQNPELPAAHQRTKSVQAGSPPSLAQAAPRPTTAATSTIKRPAPRQGSGRPRTLEPNQNTPGFPNVTSGHNTQPGTPAAAPPLTGDSVSGPLIAKRPPPPQSRVSRTPGRSIAPPPSPSPSAPFIPVAQAAPAVQIPEGPNSAAEPLPALTVPFSSLDPALPADIPAALAITETNAQAGTIDPAVLDQMTDQFLSEVAQGSQDPKDPEYQKLWEQAQALSDIRMRAAYGNTLWLHQHQEAYRQAMGNSAATPETTPPPAAP